jgi:hypothetical protein
MEASSAWREVSSAESAGERELEEERVRMRASRPVPSRGVRETVKGECQRRERQEVGEREQAGRTTRVLLQRRYLASLGPVLLVL